MTFRDFIEGMWDTDGKQGEAATPLHKPSDGQPFKQYARGGKPRGNTGGGGGMFAPQQAMGGGGMFMKKMKKA